MTGSSLLFLLMLLVACSQAQLSNLINLVRGGVNPVNPGPDFNSQAVNSQAVNSQAVAVFKPSAALRPAVPVSPIPFSEFADPSRGVVDIDVPQPRPGQGVGAGVPNPLLSGVPAAPAPPRPSGLPAGAKQVGGRPVSAPKPARKPVPLNEIEPPVFLSTVFPSPLNAVNPLSPPRREPEESLRHRFLPGAVPQPVAIGGDQLPVAMVLNHQNTQRLADNNRFNYDRFGGEVFPNLTGVPAVSQQREGEHFAVDVQHPSFQQADTRHKEAMRKHLQGIIQKKQETAEAGQSPALPRGQHQHAVNFLIPGRDRHKEYEEELRLAQQALTALG